MQNTKSKSNFEEALGSLPIGEISRRTGVKVVTLRFYETLGLLPSSSPAKARHRRFQSNIVSRVELIKTARAAGLSLPEIRELFNLLKGFQPPAVRKMEALRAKIQGIDRKVSLLLDLKRLLRGVLENPDASRANFYDIKTR